MQFDIDIVGTQNLLADAEIIAAMATTMEHLGVKRFLVRYSNRKILNGLVAWAGIPAERGADVMRVIDKLEKQGKEAVLLELGPGRIDSSGDKIPGLGLAISEIKKLEQFLDFAMLHTESPLDKAEEMLGSQEIARAGIEELRRIETLLGHMGISRDQARVDLTIVRGLGYYTGPVFETTLLDLPQYGSMFSGGRYDNLVDRFLGRSIPAVGTSLGVDRLLAALFELKAIESKSATSQVLVTVMDRERIPEYLAIVGELRLAGIPSEIFSGDTKNLSKQIKYGDKVGIPFAVIAGSDEFATGKLTVKNLAAGKSVAKETSDREEWLAAEGFQETILRTDLVAYIRRKLTEAKRG
jgi:histidyl-tRNA synthetase